MLFDTHCHLNFAAYKPRPDSKGSEEGRGKEDADQVIRRSLDEGVWLNIVGSQNTTSKRAVEQAENYKEGVYATIGLHPIHLYDSYIDETEIQFRSRAEEWNPQYYRNLAKSKKVVAVGEMGLDYYHIKDHAPDIETAKKKQKEVFAGGIKLAQELNLPLIIHCRDAHEDVLTVIAGTSSSVIASPEGAIGVDSAKSSCGGSPVGGQSQPSSPRYVIPAEAGIQSGRPKSSYGGSPAGGQSDAKHHPERSRRISYRGVIHCFGGTLEQAQKYLNLGFLIGFTGTICFPPKKSAPQIQENLWNIVKKIPLEKILIETDAPYLAPPPFRGKRNEPAYVRYVAQKIAELKGITFNQVAAQTTQTAKQLFNL